MTFALVKNFVSEKSIVDIISTIIPFDDLESQHIQKTLAWISSGAQIFRLKKPDIPPKHLVSYFILFDERAQKILLVDHIKSQLWLPAGGHVEPGEHPQDTVSRECLEELGIDTDFWCESPFFLTSTVTVGFTPGHTDVSLWYILKGDKDVSYSFDRGEFNAIQWFGWDEIPFERSDPHMERFIQKLKESL
ncbi:MAG: NUDIX hydrolase [Alphaproteobacteria bacterium]|nr:NUDIX hydrolase [Alphaproteobacteria bacterium]